MSPFDGDTYVRERDHSRLRTLMDHVSNWMQDGEWHTLPEIVEACGGTQASVSARLRDLRKKKFGGYAVERRYIEDGLYEYRVLWDTPSDAKPDRRSTVIDAAKVWARDCEGLCDPDTECSICRELFKSVMGLTAGAQ